MLSLHSTQLHSWLRLAKTVAINKSTKKRKRRKEEFEFKFSELLVTLAKLLPRELLTSAANWHCSKKRRSHAEPSLALHCDSTSSPSQIHHRPTSTSSGHRCSSKVANRLCCWSQSAQTSNFFGKEVLVIFVARSVTVFHNLLISKTLFCSEKWTDFWWKSTKNDTKVYSEVVINYLAPKQKRDISWVVHTFIESRNLDKK